MPNVEYEVMLKEGEITFVLDGLAGFYLLLVLVPLAAGAVVLAITPLLKRWMHGVN